MNSVAVECAETVLLLLPSDVKHPQMTPSNKKCVNDGQDWRLIVFLAHLRSCEKRQLRVPCPPLRKLFTNQYFHRRYLAFPHRCLANLHNKSHKIARAPQLFVECLLISSATRCTDSIAAASCCAL